MNYAVYLVFDKNWNNLNILLESTNATDVKSP